MANAPRLKPCPFCSVNLIYIESPAMSFEPPRVYREIHHPNNDCAALAGKAWFFTDNMLAFQKFTTSWDMRLGEIPREQPPAS